MCMLTYLPAGVQPDRIGLENGAEVNRMGHGFAIVCLCNPAKPKIIVRKSMSSITLIDDFIAARKHCDKGPALFHSRITTAGLTNEENCHPFFIGGDPRTVLAHNGILPRNVQPGKDDDRSDTRICAEDFIPHAGGVHTAKARKQFESWATKNYNNKLVILTVDPKYNGHGFIINEAGGEWDKDTGIWYSNSDYCGWSTKYFRYGYEGDSWSYWDKGWTNTLGKSNLPVPAQKLTTPNAMKNGVEGTYEYRRMPDGYLKGKFVADGEQLCERLECLNVFSADRWYCPECTQCISCFEDMADCACWDEVPNDSKPHTVSCGLVECDECNPHAFDFDCPCDDCRARATDFELNSTNMTEAEYAEWLERTFPATYAKDKARGAVK